MPREASEVLHAAYIPRDRVRSTGHRHRGRAVTSETACAEVNSSMASLSADSLTCSRNLPKSMELEMRPNPCSHSEAAAPSWYGPCRLYLPESPGELTCNSVGLRTSQCARGIPLIAAVSLCARMATTSSRFTRDIGSRSLEALLQALRQWRSS